MSTAAVTAGLAVCAAVAASITAVAAGTGGRPSDWLSRQGARPAALIREVVREAFGAGDVQQPNTGRRQTLIASGIAAVLGFSLLGPGGAVVAAIAAPWLRTRFVKWRRSRTAARIDEGCTELALALSSALAAGNSVRGALLVAGPALEGPMRDEVDKLAVDLTLGMSVEDSMAAMRDRTRSPRVEALAGALALHRGSGGDLVMLMRELASAFRGRDRALRDARSASVQARYTAGVVAVIPVAAGGLCELIAPGSIVGTLSFLPTAVMLALALAGIVMGVAASWRVGRA